MKFLHSESPKTRKWWDPTSAYRTQPRGHFSPTYFLYIYLSLLRFSIIRWIFQTVSLFIFSWSEYDFCDIASKLLEASHWKCLSTRSFPEIGHTEHFCDVIKRIIWQSYVLKFSTANAVPWSPKMDGYHENRSDSSSLQMGTICALHQQIPKLVKCKSRFAKLSGAHLGTICDKWTANI